MFTGIVEHVGRLAELGDSTLWVEVPWEVRAGESIAVDGCCLTVSETKGRQISFQTSPETLSRTTLKEKGIGSELNLERGMKFGSSVDGHLVSGHIDATGTIEKVLDLDGGNQEWVISYPPSMAGWLAQKGSIAVDGVSLTVNQVSSDSFSVVVIPFTLAHTTFEKRKAGDHVNLEFDLIGKYVARQIEIRS